MIASQLGTLYQDFIGVSFSANTHDVETQENFD